MTSLQFCKKTCSFWFGFTKLTAGFSARLWYAAKNDVLLCCTVPTNWQPKWFRTRTSEIWHKEKHFDCRSYNVGKCNFEWDNVKTFPKLPKSVSENRTAEAEFSDFWKTNIRHFQWIPHTPILLTTWAQTLIISQSVTTESIMQKHCAVKTPHQEHSQSDMSTTQQNKNDADG